MCGEGCLCFNENPFVTQVKLVIPRKNKPGKRVSNAHLIRRVGEPEMIAPHGCGAAINLEQFLERNRALIIEPY